jgi:hypothetical protein
MDLKKLQGEIVTLSTGEKLTIKPIGFGKLSIFNDATASLITKIQGTGFKLSTIKDWQILFDIAFEETIAIMALVIDKKRKFFDDISIADGLGILAKIIEQNFNDDAKKNLKIIVAKFSSLLPTAFKFSSAPDIVARPLTDIASKKSGHS